MADSHWTSYVGMVSGVIGVAVASYSLYKTSKIKTLDLRLELKRSALDLNALHEELKEILDRTLKSRKNISAAMGTYQSDGMKFWQDEHAIDKKTWQEMKDLLPDKNRTYKKLNAEELEQELVKVHEQKSVLVSIKEKYIESMRKDEKNSEFLRGQAHKSIQRNT